MVTRISPRRNCTSSVVCGFLSSRIEKRSEGISTAQFFAVSEQEAAPHYCFDNDPLMLKYCLRDVSEKSQTKPRRNKFVN